MTFSAEEKKSAQSLPQTIHNYYGATNVINAPSDGMQIVTGNESVVFSYKDAQSAMTEIAEAVKSDELSAEDKDTALELIAEINDKLIEHKKPTIIKSLLVGLKDFLINAGGAFAASLIQAKLPGLF